MIITRLAGGLGNQLFQYALGRRLSLHHQTVLKIDQLDLVHTLPQRSYELSHFNIEEHFASSDEIAARRPRKWKRVWEGLKPYYWRHHIIEKNMNFDKNLFKSGPDIYLQGFWQSPQYFQDIESTLQKDLTFKNLPSTTNQQLTDLMHSQNSVAIHVRRMDFANDQTISQVHGTCSPEYYGRAIEKVNHEIDSVRFYIFSDDMPWVRQNLKLPPETTFVDHHTPEQGAEDLRLMSSCKHFIIANSTFSWWGAWLGQHKKKIVIAPKKWMNDPTREPRDIIPTGWLRI